MKHYASIILFVCCIGSGRTSAQTQEVQQLILNLQKLKQLKEILDNMYRGYKILNQGYTTIKNISEGNYSLHEAFLDGLMQVNPAVRNYKRVPMIIDYQKMLVSEYRRAYHRFKKDSNFSTAEIAYMSRVYTNLLDASLKNLDDLLMIITATKLRMSDDERMAAIDRIYLDLENKLVFLRTFNSSTATLAIQRARNAQDVETMKQLYDLK